MDHSIKIFSEGIHNLVDSEVIPSSAAQDSKNFVTQDGKLKLSNGRALIGAEGVVGTIQGLHWGYRAVGTKILFRKTDTVLQYLSGTTWTDIVTGLTSGAEYSFANYTSLAGSFVFASGIDGLYKINTANPADAINLYDAVKNDKGKIMIDKGRLIMWDCLNYSKTTLLLSWIDRQNSDVYTTVTAEAIGTAAANFTGTLAFKAGGAKRNSFGLQLSGTTGGTAETFTDNKDGTLTSDKGGTGTINYTTGVYDFTFSATCTSAVCTYFWEDSTAEGLADFTFSATRVASEGNRITQDIGGDEIMKVEVGQDGAYYSLKKHSSYRLAISADDITFTNLVYRRNIGISNWRASVSTSKGIMFMNTANPEKPEMTILQRNPLGDNVEPVVLFPQFKFANYNFDDCAIDTWERYIVVTCRETDDTVNRTILLCDTTQGTVDVTYFPARMFAKDSGILYIGSSMTQSVHKVFNGFDDEGYAIENFWIGRGEQYTGKRIAEKLKKFRKLRLKGLIDPDQVVEIYASYDDAGFQLVGTIRGDAPYVDYATPQFIGSNMIGTIQIGGDDTVSAYPYFMELKLNTPKFRKREIKIMATGIGYFDIESMMDWDILTFEQRIPKRFRQKQAVSLDGTSEDN